MEVSQDGDEQRRYRSFATEGSIPVLSLSPGAARRLREAPKRLRLPIAREATILRRRTTSACECECVCVRGALRSREAALDFCLGPSESPHGRPSSCLSENRKEANGKI